MKLQAQVVFGIIEKKNTFIIFEKQRGITAEFLDDRGSCIGLEEARQLVGPVKTPRYSNSTHADRK